MVSKSCGYVGILALSIVAIIVITCDILKYHFEIDPARQELQKIQQRRIERKKQQARIVQKPRVAIRFIYVDRPKMPNQLISGIEDTQ